MREKYNKKFCQKIFERHGCDYVFLLLLFKIFKNYKKHT